MEYRLATIEEIAQLKPIFDEYDSPIPDPLFSKVAVAIDSDGMIQGFLALQLVYHESPLYIAEESRGKVDIFTLQKVIEDLFNEHSVHPYPFAITTDERMDSLMERCGFTEVPCHRLWRKQIQ